MEFTKNLRLFLGAVVLGLTALMFFLPTHNAGTSMAGYLEDNGMSGTNTVSCEAVDVLRTRVRCTALGTRGTEKYSISAEITYSSRKLWELRTAEGYVIRGGPVPNLDNWCPFYQPPINDFAESL